VITIAAVNKSAQRIGYSAQGPGMFAQRKPDLAAYSHIYAHFGPGRPGGGGAGTFDNGTSAATPLAVGVAALLLQAFPGVPPQGLKRALTSSAWRSGGSGWDRDYGHGVIDALSAWNYLKGQALTS
jgi:serine protease AprX